MPDPETYLEAARVLERLGNDEAAERWRRRAEAAAGEAS